MADDGNLAAMFQAVVLHANDAVLVTEAEPVEREAGGPRIVYANPAFTKATGYTLEEVLGKTPRILQGPKTDRAELDRLHAALKRWQTVRVELLNYRKDGSEFWVELDIVPVADATGWFTHWISIQRDITARKLAEQALQQAMAEAEEASRAKTQYLGSMGHELRTPLNAIIGFADIIRRSMAEGDPQFSRYAGFIHSAGEHLLGVVNDLLDMARLQSGALVLHEQTVELPAVMAECRAMLALQAEKAGVALAVELPADPPRLRADLVRLRQILVNLVGNAVKFTPRGGRVALRAERTGGGLALVVADSGIGMTAEEVELALQPFRQLPAGGQRDGAGLGLPIAQALAELHGGRLVIESRPGMGTVAKVVLPPERLVIGDGLR
ncbi:MAG TPA: ATP-binding protein [Alphaproteobacteria bacterium]|nr:ATP-binding protein [Alphaproteobacteria bacterium]